MTTERARLTLSHLSKEYRNELAKLDRYDIWQEKNNGLPWQERDWVNEPKPNKAKIKRLGIMIREIMIDTERGL